MLPRKLSLDVFNHSKASLARCSSRTIVKPVARRQLKAPCRAHRHRAVQQERDRHHRAQLLSAGLLLVHSTALAVHRRASLPT